MKTKTFEVTYMVLTPDGPAETCLRCDVPADRAALAMARLNGDNGANDAFMAKYDLAHLVLAYAALTGQSILLPCENSIRDYRVLD